MVEASSSASYHAFISYSHRDRSWGEWLHKALEHYKVPKALAGRPTSRGEPVPARIYPVFRDREELPTAFDLGEIITRALAQSRYLIVICSPASARSQWVNQEIIEFKRLGGENRVLAIIVEGEPNAASGKAGFTADDECFPEALRFKLGSDGLLSGESTEPIAADARPHADGKADALLKLAAGVLGVGYDELKRRDEVQRRRRQRLAMSIISGVAVVVSGLAVTAWMQRAEAISGRKEAVAQRNLAREQTARAELALARVNLNSGETQRAAVGALSAIEQSESAGKPLEAAWWVLRRALEAERVEQLWQAHEDGVNEVGFDATGTRLLTFSVADGEARIWSAPDGRLLAKIAPGPGTQLAGWNGPDEVVTVRSWEREVGEGVSAGLELTTEVAYWNAYGNKLKANVLSNCAYWSQRHTTDGCPSWIELRDFSREEVAYRRLVRLRDGWSDLSLPAMEGQLTFVPDCSIVLYVEESGVRLYSLMDGRELGVLEGVDATERLSVTSVASSADRRMLAAIVSEKGKDHITRVKEVGIWLVADGSRVSTFLPNADQAVGNHWIGNSGPKHLAGYPKPMTDEIASKLGLASLPLEHGYVGGHSRHDHSKRGTTLALLDHHGRLSLVYPDQDITVNLETEPARPQAMAIAPNGDLLASGDDRGMVRLWRATSPFAANHLPAGVKMIDDHYKWFSAPGKTVLKGADNRVLLWDSREHRLVASVPVSAATVGKNPRYVWTGSDEWLIEVPGNVAAIRSADASEPPDDSEAAFYHPRTGKIMGTRRIGFGFFPSSSSPHAVVWGKGWELLTHKGTELIHTALEWQAGAVHDTRCCFAFAGEGEHLIAATPDGWMLMFSVNSGKITRAFRFAPDLGEVRISEMSLSSSARWALVHSSDVQKSWCVDFSTGEAKEIPITNENFQGALISEEESLIVYRDFLSTRWLALPDLTPMASVRGSFGSVARIPESKLLALASHDEVLLADSESGREVARYTDVLAADVSLGLGVVQTDDGLRVVRLRDGEVLAETNQRASSATISPGGSAVEFIRFPNKNFVTLPLALDKAQLRSSAERFRQRGAPSDASANPK